MRLSLDVLCISLEKEYRVKYFRSNPSPLGYHRPTLVESKITSNNDLLYFCTEDSFKIVQGLKGAFICVVNKLPKDCPIPNMDVIYVEQGKSSPIAILQSLHSIYSFFEDWEKDMVEVIENSSINILKEFLEVGTRVIKNPITVSDSSLRCICKATFDEKSEKSNVALVESFVPFPLENITKINQLYKPERSITVPYMTSYEFVLNDSNTRAYCNNIYSSGIFLGCIHITPSLHPFRPSDLFLANIFFLHFQKAYKKFLKNFNMKETPGSSILKAYISGKNDDAADKDSLALQKNQYWRCFKLKEKKGSTHVTKEYAHGNLELLLYSLVYTTIYNDDIIGIIRITTDYEGNEIESNLELLSEVLEQINYIAGLSNPFSNLKEINHYLDQADFALNHFGPADIKSPIENFEDCIFDYMLLNCKNNVHDISTLYTNGFKKLLDYDKNKSSDLVHTLKVYLSNESGISQTAKDLYIHRSSLLKRLAKIQALLNDDLKDPNKRLYYRMILELIEI